MFNKALLLAIIMVIVMLTLAAIEFLPGTLYFPVVEYATPGDIRFVLLRSGEPDEARCGRTTNQIAAAVRASCADCKIVKRCARGLDAEQRRILSREPLATPSLRSEDGMLTMTIFAADAQLALSVCRLTENQTASSPANKRLACYPAAAPRR